MNQTLRGITYVSVWVVIWGTVASLMDWMLLTGEVYKPARQVKRSPSWLRAAAVVMATRYAGRFLASADQQSSNGLKARISGDAPSGAELQRLVPIPP